MTTNAHVLPPKQAAAAENTPSSARTTGKLDRTGPGTLFIVIGCILLVAICLFPFWWMSLSSIKTLREL
jgi:ABC-type glycerol-3-phosphate transport system permease component